MADVNIDSAIATLGRGMRTMVFNSPNIGYAFYIDDDGTFGYSKTTDGGATWGAQVEIAANTTTIAFDVWFDQWTPGDTGTLIHTWWFDSTADAVRWRTLDTNGDTLGTARQAFGGASAVAGRGAFCSGTKTRSGYLYVAFDIDAGAEKGLYRSTNNGVNWSSLSTTFVEATIDECSLFPATGTGDDNDCWAIYHDASADALTIKMWDSSAAAEVESDTLQTCIENTTDGSGQRPFSGAIRHSDGHLIVVSCSERDTSTADMQAWDVSAVNAGSLTGITALTNLTTNIDDLYHPSVFINQNNDDIYVAYNGKSDGSENYLTTAKVYYAKSTNGGSSWSMDNAMMADAANTQSNVWAPISGPRFIAMWRRGGFLVTNSTNSINLPYSSNGSSTGTGTASGVSASSAGSTGSSTGDGSASGLGASIWNSVGFSDTTIADSYSEANQDSEIELSFSFPGKHGVGQAFTAVSGRLDRAKFYLRKAGSPTGNAVAKLYAISGTFGTNAKPTGTALAISDNFSVSTLTTSFALITFQFSGSNRYLLSGGTNYCIVVEYSAGSPPHHILIGTDQSSPSHAGNYSFLFNTTWTGDSAADVPFYVYIDTVSGTSASIWGSISSAAGVGAALTVGASLFLSSFSSTGAADLTGNSSATWNAVASSDGVGTAVAVSLSTSGSIGSSDGTGTASGESSVVSGSVGSSGGTGTALAVSSVVSGTVGSSDGLGTVTGLASAIWDSLFASDGVGTATADSSSIAGTVGSSDGTGTASGISSAFASSSASSDGAGIADAQASATFQGVTSADGTGTATAIASAIWGSVFDSSGTGSATAEGTDAASTGTDGSAAGTGTASAIGSSTATASASSDGAGVATGFGVLVIPAVGATDGVGAAGAPAAAISNSVASSAGTGTATADSETVESGSTASATGVGSASAASAVVSSSAASSTGTGTVTATSEATLSSTGSSFGTGSASAVATALWAVEYSATGTATANATSTEVQPSDGTSSGVGSADAIATALWAVQSSSTGTSTVTAQSSRILAIGRISIEAVLAWELSIEAILDWEQSFSAVVPTDFTEQITATVDQPQSIEIETSLLA